MYKNGFYIALVVVVGALSLWWIEDAVRLTYNYYSLSSTTTAYVTAIEAVEKAEDDYRIQLTYTYVVNKNSYTHSELLPSAYLNSFAAQKAKNEFRDKTRPLYFDSKNPTHASLTHSFPFKQCLYAIVLLGICFYFIALGYLVKKKAL